MTGLNKHGKGLHLAHLKVRSRFGSHKLDMLKKQDESSKVDIFTISETWLNSSILDNIVEIPNYNVVRLDRGWTTENNQGAAFVREGGLAMYIGTNIEFSDTEFSHLNQSTKDLEMQWVLICLQNIRSILVVNIYRPPQGDYKKGCKLITEGFEKAVLRDNREIFIMKDFNMDLSKTTTPSYKELDFTMRLLGLPQFVLDPTRS